MANLGKLICSLDFQSHPENTSTIIMSQANHCEVGFIDTKHKKYSSTVWGYRYSSMYRLTDCNSCNTHTTVFKQFGSDVHMLFDTWEKIKHLFALELDLLGLPTRSQVPVLPYRKGYQYCHTGIPVQELISVTPS